MAARKRSRIKLGNYLGGVLIGGVVVAIVLLNLPSRNQDTEWPGVHFQDVTSQSGISFKHTSGVSRHKLLPETMGSGVAVIDYDCDGHADLFFVNSCDWPGLSKSPTKSTSAMYRNMGDGTFTDVTVALGLDIEIFGMGVTVGDYDNDGWPDLFVTGVGGNILLKNMTGNRFHDVTRIARVGGPGGWTTIQAGNLAQSRRPVNWSTSATFLDYDGDGWLDLFVCNYVTWSPARDIEQGFRLATGEPAYGPPRAFGGTHCFLYRNEKNGTFTDVTTVAGIEVSDRGEPVGKALGVISCDVDGDGWCDIIVANDTQRNFFFHNIADPKSGDRRFREIGELTGVAYADRVARGAMGIDWGPGYGRNKNAIVIGNFADEPNTLLVQQRPNDLQFVDLATSEGLAGPSRNHLKFGVFFFDFDLDGRLDIFSCNGHLEPDINRSHNHQEYAQPPQLFWNRGGRLPRFVSMPESVLGKDLYNPLVGRSCSYFDMDQDGDLDIVLTGNGQAPRLLRNDNTTGHHWIRLKIEGNGITSNRSGIGAKIILESKDRVQRREISAARGYLSQSETIVTFGLGEQTVVDKITISWPGSHSGPPSILISPAIDQLHEVVQSR